MALLGPAKDKFTAYGAIKTTFLDMALFLKIEYTVRSVKKKSLVLVSRTYKESLLIANYPFGNSPTRKNPPLTSPNGSDVMATHTCLRNVRTYLIFLFSQLHCCF